VSTDTVRSSASQVTEAVSFGCKFYFRNGNTILLRTVCNKKQRWNTVVHHFSEHTNLETGEGRECQRERGITMHEGVVTRGNILATVELLERPHGSHFRIKAGLGSVVLRSNFVSDTFGSGEIFSAVTENGGSAVP
jgi:hypothetical protein